MYNLNFQYDSKQRFDHLMFTYDCLNLHVPLVQNLVPGARPPYEAACVTVKDHQGSCKQMTAGDVFHRDTGS